MIQLLDENTINKISAGEVVERPLNVVKELVENALDAGAVSVQVEIEKAGKKLISVTDNGCGMDKSDLEKCIYRHTTSKITKFEDIANISSLGFRGEALASISAVSMFTIKTQTKGTSSGWQLSVDGEKTPEVQPWAGSVGTTVEVRNLFFNTPVREKFLKSDTTEKSKILSCLDEIALVRNDINLKIISDGKVVADYQKTDSKLKRIEEVLGKGISVKLKHISYGHPTMDINGFITTRNNSLAQRNVWYLFVNGRCVNYPKWLIHAVNQACKSAIPIGRYPGIILFLKTSPSDIDINIHPTKREIKFAYENQMYDLFYSFIKTSLEEDAPVSIMENSSSITDNVEPFVPQEEKKSFSSFSGGRNYGGSRAYSSYGGSSYVPSPKVDINDYKKLYEDTDKKNISFNEPITEYKQTNLIDDENSFKFIGQIFETYLLAEKEDTFYVIDQHAAQERVRYEMFSGQLEQNSLKIQQLLIPDIFELPKPKVVVLKNYLDLFNKLGFTVEEFGDNSFRLTSYPALLGYNINFTEIIDVLVDFLQDEKSADIEQIREKIIRASCRTSIKAGDKVQDVQARALLKDLFNCKMPWTCPHGRPTVYKLTLSDIEKFFKRT